MVHGYMEKFLVFLSPCMKPAAVDGDVMDICFWPLISQRGLPQQMVTAWTIFWSFLSPRGLPQQMVTEWTIFWSFLSP